MSIHGINFCDSETAFRRLFRYSAWFQSRWFTLTASVIVSAAIFVGISTGAPATYVFGQIFLGLSVYLSMFVLADRPLINPVQAVVLMFYFWFGVGPVVVSSWQYFLNIPDVALNTQISGMESLPIVALGLPIYAFVSRFTLKWLSATGLYARFLMPEGANYRTKVLIIYLSLAGLSALSLIILPSLGIQGIEEVGILGGTKTNVWWVGVIAGVGLISPLIMSALISYLATPWREIPFAVRILIALILVVTVINALFGGWKGPLAFMGAYYACAYVSRRQRPPWLFLGAGAFTFLVFITPFVTHGRHLAEISRVSDSAMRKQIFSEMLSSPEGFIPTAVEDINPAVLFRGIYPLAGEVARRNELFYGEWQGDTIKWGLEILIPRALNPDKRDMNIGNFFSQTVGADIGVTSRENLVNSIGVSLPFEIVGNYGYLAGVISFGLIGLFWSFFSGWVLSPARLSTHPLAPFMILTAMGMEGAFGHYLAKLRGLIIPFFLCFMVYKMLRGKI